MFSVILILASLTALKPQVPNLPTVTVARLAAYQRLHCENYTEPQPIDTPDPMVNSMTHGVVINFLIGENGRVDSPLILESDDSHLTDEQVMRTVRRWRFRPATCGGVPTETEAAFQFTEE